MKFWSLEVKPCQEQEVKLNGSFLILKQACIGDADEVMDESIVVKMKVTVNEQTRIYELVTLNPISEPQMLLAWAFEDDFRVSHNMKNGSIYLLGIACKRRFTEALYQIIHNSYCEEIVIETQSPTFEDCMKMLENFPDLQEDPFRSQAQKALEKKFLRQTFMSFDTDGKRIDFLKWLVEKASLPI